MRTIVKPQPLNGCSRTGRTIRPGEGKSHQQKAGSVLNGPLLQGGSFSPQNPFDLVSDGPQTVFADGTP